MRWVAVQTITERALKDYIIIKSWHVHWELWTVCLVCFYSIIKPAVAMKKPHGNPFWGCTAPCDSDSQIKRTQLSGQCGLYSLKGYFGVGLGKKNSGNLVLTSLREEFPRRTKILLQWSTQQSLNLKNIKLKIKVKQNESLQSVLHVIYLQCKCKKMVQVWICWDNLPLLSHLKAQMNIL